MSTKAIRQMIEDATADHPMTPRLTAEGIRAALAEVEAIELAAGILSGRKVAYPGEHDVARETLATIAREAP